LSVKIHGQCQKNVGNSIRKRKANPSITLGNQSKIAKMTTRKSIDTFNWKEHCLFCGEECHIDTKHPERRPIFEATFLHYRDSILGYCESRNDSGAEDVKRRVINCIDLVQAEGRYQDDCRIKFTGASVSSIKPKGRLQIQHSKLIAKSCAIGLKQKASYIPLLNYMSIHCSNHVWIRH